MQIQALGPIKNAQKKFSETYRSNFLLQGLTMLNKYKVKIKFCCLSFNVVLDDLGFTVGSWRRQVVNFLAAQH